MNSLETEGQGTLYERMAAVWPEGTPFFIVTTLAGAVYTHAKVTDNRETQLVTMAVYLSTELLFIKEKYYKTRIKDPYAEVLTTAISTLAGAIFGAVSYKASASLASFFH